MVSPFDYRSFPELVGAVKAEVKQKTLAKTMGLPVQTVNTVFNGDEHLVYSRVGKWRSALKLRQPEGDYFELLSLVHAYPLAGRERQERMLKRAFHLAGRLEASRNPEQRIAESVIYWLDPLLSILREMTDLNDCPADEAEIPQWAASRITYLGSFACLKKDQPKRVAVAWNWLKHLDAVRFDADRNRWIKREPIALKLIEPDASLRVVTEDLIRLVHINYYADFIHELAHNRVFGSKQAVFTMPGKAVDLLNRVLGDFLFGEILEKFSYLVNQDDARRLQQEDPERYEEIARFRRLIEQRGYEIPRTTDEDMDTTVQIMVSARRLTQ